MTLRTWLWTSSIFSVPRIGWAIVTALAVLDVVFAHSKNPRIMHLTSAVALLTGAVIKALGIASIPVFGPVIMAVLNVLIGPVPALPDAPAPAADPPAAA